MTPDWGAAAAHARELGHERACREVRGGCVIDLISHSSLSKLHSPERDFHDENPERLARLLGAFPGFVEGGPASREAIERVHAPEYLTAIEEIDSETWLLADTYADETTWEAARLAAGCALGAVEQDGLRTRPAAGPSRSREQRDGILHLQQRRDRRSARPV